MTNGSLKILLSCQSRDGAEKINHLFRNAGQAAQTHRVTSIEDLNQCLNDDQWDLALCEESNAELKMHTVLQEVVSSNSGTPVVLLLDDASNENIVNGLKNGAQDAVDIAHQEHLLYVANREIKNARFRRVHSDLERSLQEVNGRFETLMSTAEDAVAYVLDGIHVNVNAAYANAFGINDVDEFLAIPLIDLVAECDQESFRNFLRHYNEESEQELTVSFVPPEGEQFSARLRFAPAVFDDEQCTQLILRKLDAEAAADDVSVKSTAKDPGTGLQDRYSMVDLLQEYAADEQKVGCLLYIGISDFASLKRRHGLSGSRIVREAVATIVERATSDYEAANITHYGEDSFTVLLPDAEESVAMRMARSLCEQVEEAIIDIEDHTAQCSCCVGVVNLADDEFTDSNDVLDKAFMALEEARQLYAEDSSIAGVVLHRPGNTSPKTAQSYDVRELVGSNRLRMMFQPVINLHGEAAESYEATLRLLDDEYQEQAVDPLFQAMNQKPGDTSLDKWLVVEGTKNLKAQHETGKRTMLTINLTQNALIDNTFSNWLGVAMKAAQLSPECIILQFSESTISHYLKQAMRFQQEVSEWKFRFGLNQFGRDPESVKVLQHYKADYAFIDASFALNLQKDPTNTENLKTVLNRLQENKVASIVPYVENAATLACLWQMNVHYIQGHYLQAPGEQMDYEFSEPG